MVGRPGLASDVLARLRSAKSILLPTTPERRRGRFVIAPGDYPGAEAIRRQATPVVGDGDLPNSLRFLPGIEHVLVYGERPLPEYDLLCMADCSDRRRLGRFYTDDPSRVDGTIPIINIDHHITNDHFGELNVVEPLAASASEIVAELLRLWGTKLTRNIAQCLLAGIYGDTLGSAHTGHNLQDAPHLS